MLLERLSDRVPYESPEEEQEGLVTMNVSLSLRASVSSFVTCVERVRQCVLGSCASY
jgi:hypothetical protein